MAIETIYCPACNNKLRVPDELMGQEVQCPKCRAMFTAPPPPSAVMPADHPGAPPQRMPGGRDDFGYEDDRWGEERGRAAGYSRRKGPGIALIAIGLLQALMNIYGLTIALVNPDELRKQFQQIQAMLPMAGPPPFDPVKAQLLSNGVFLLMSIIQMAGGISLLKGRLYSLALIGAILAIVNCNQLCCVAGIPIGIWSVIVLFDANVKAEFA